MTHTEKVHVIFGVLAALTGGLAAWSALRPASRARYVWPVLTFLIGFFLFVPVEAQTRTYQEVSWWGTLLSAVPDNPGYWVHNWFAKLDHWHVVQHKVGGLMIMLVGAITWRRARGWVPERGWRLVLPLLLIAIGVAFGVHGGSSAHLPFHVEQVQHHVFGAGFVVGGILLGLAELGYLHAPFWRAAWAVLVLMVGLNIAFFYRLPPEDRGMEMTHQ